MFRPDPLLQPPAPSWVAHFATGAEPARFTPWGSEPEAQIADDGHETDSDDAPADLAAMEAEAFAAGFDEGRRTLEAEIAGEREAIAALAASLAALRPEPAEPLAALLAETVERLVREIVGTAQIDGDLLGLRASQAAALIGEETEPARLLVHPDDLPLLEAAEIPVELAGDPALVRGSVRLERASGWIEDGPEIRLDRLRAALAQLGAPQ